MSDLLGIFDSGVGGLSVARCLVKDIPDLSFIYFGDTLYVPYGEREVSEVVELIDKICHHLVSSGVKALVMACNTSSALAYEHVISWSPVPVIGIIEEAAKAAVKVSQNKKIGVMSNMLTANSGAYAKACHRATSEDVEVFSIGCPRLVPLVEAGNTQSQEAREALLSYWEPLHEQGVDTLVLGCTHFPFLRPLLEEIVGPNVSIIDPAHYVAQKVRELNLSCEGGVRRIYQASGNPLGFAWSAHKLLGYHIGQVEHIDL